tara:strand:+ start:3378 stop:3620 length:243 start_codon:yes stop_codon:yes gene_type:complete
MQRGAEKLFLGPIFFLVEDGHLARVWYADGPSKGTDAELNETTRQLTEYFLGERYAFDLPLAPAISPSQAQQRACMIDIP